MKFSIVAVGAFAAGTAVALPFGQVIPAGAHEYVINVSSADGSISGAISQKDGKLGLFPGLPPAKFYTTTYEPAKTLALHIGDDSNQVILVGNNGLLDMDDLNNPSTNSIPKGKLAEWSTFTIAPNGALGVKDGSDIPSRKWIAYAADGGYTVALYDGYTANSVKMTTVRVMAQDANASPAPPAVPAPAPAPAPVPTPVAPAPKQQIQPRPVQPIQPRPQPVQQQAPRPQPSQQGNQPRPAQQGSPYPRVGQPGSPYPRPQSPSLSNLHPYTPQFGGSAPAPAQNGGQYQPYSPAQQPAWNAPPAAPIYPSPDGPSGSSGPSPSAGGAPTPVKAAPPASTTNWWDPLGLFGKPAPSTAVSAPSPTSDASDYQPAVGSVDAPTPPVPSPSPTTNWWDPFGLFSKPAATAAPTPSSSDNDDGPDVPDPTDTDSKNKQ